MNACRAGMSNALTTPRPPPARRCATTRTRPLERERRQHEGEEHRQRLGRDDDGWRLKRSATAPPIGARRKTGIWPQNATMPSSADGAGQAVDKPGLRDRLHPGAGQRDELAAEEELVVAVAKRVDGVSHSGVVQWMEQEPGPRGSPQ